MALWNRTPQATPEPPAPPADPPSSPPADDRLERLTGAVAQLTEIQLRQAQPQPQAPAAPPPIQDISEDEYNAAYESQDYREIQRVERVRRNAEIERVRREAGARIGQLESQGVGAINRLTKQSLLREDPYYHKDAAYKRTVDGYLSEVERSGRMLDEATMRFVLDKATGEHHTRLVKEEVEAQVRAAREQVAAGSGKAGRGAGAHPGPSDADYGLGPEQMAALSHLNKGRGRTPDEFAQELPPRRVKYTDYEGPRPVQRQQTLRYETFGDALSQQAWAEKEYERQRQIMCGEIPPNTPVTPRN